MSAALAVEVSLERLGELESWVLMSPGLGCWDWWNSQTLHVLVQFALLASGLPTPDTCLLPVFLLVLPLAFILKVHSV